MISDRHLSLVEDCYALYRLTMSDVNATSHEEKLAVRSWIKWNKAYSKFGTDTCKTLKKVAILSWIKWNRAYARFGTDVFKTLKKTKGKETKEGIDYRYVGQDNKGNWIEVAGQKSSRTKTITHTALYTTTKNNFTPLTDNTDPSENTHDTITNMAYVPQKYMMSDTPGTTADKRERKIQRCEHCKLTLLHLAR